MKSKASLKTKAIFIFLLILGNALMALITFSEEPEEFAVKSVIKRPGYVRLRVSGSLKAELSSESPVTLVGQTSSNVIKHVFVIKRYKRELSAEDFMQNKKQEQFLVSAPQEQALKMLKEESFTIYPHGINVAQPQRKKSYEIVY